MKGGKREGAGRKPGSLTKKNRAIAEKALQEGITPLEAMLEAMRFHLALAHDETDQKAKAAHLSLAAEHAKGAAPYMHPRLNAIEHAGKPDAPIGVIIMPSLEE
jgi:methanogenic corrinoid protein MtbC1